MIVLHNYQILHKIYDGFNSLVYRGKKLLDNQNIIIKVLKEDYPSFAELRHYQQEYEIIRHLSNLSGVIKAYSLEKYQNTLVIILEDFGGNPLSEWMINTFLNKKGLERFLDFFPIALQITDILGKIHAANIIHKDINPTNIVINPKNNQLKLIDFGIASMLPRETPTLKNLTQLEGTLTYLSPEQTGRMNRAIDYRTDLYSLGVTFYEMLTGQVPFYSDDPLELVHCHIAKTPIPPDQVNPEVPPILSKIIMKLLEKNVEDRYQSTFGLQWDLEKVFENIEKFYNFHSLELELGLHDFSGKFQISQKLYGRDLEIQALLQAFERVSQGAAEMMLIRGYSGVGKSTLVREVHKPMVEKNGYFAAGKFDQYQRNIPYFALNQAFNEFCHYLLTESIEKLNQWRQKILAAIDPNGQVLIDVIPALELIIGPQTKVSEVGPTEAQNRFNLVFQNFFRTLSQPAHPLVLFIDDLQWADSASLNLLKILITDIENHYFLIIGAYRDNEVDATHPLMMTLADIPKETSAINTIQLQNISYPDVRNLIAEALSCENTHANSLTKLVYERTQGNAFFTIEFLKSLHEKNKLFFDFKAQKWKWNIDEIVQKGFTNNVVELMANKIGRLSGETVEVLKLAACIGNQFDLSTLSIINQASKNITLTQLWQAVVEGLIFPLDTDYMLVKTLETANSRFKFQHDRVQQAAYSLIVDNDKQSIHWQIGQLLLANTSVLEEQLFEITDHLNVGCQLITKSYEKIKLAELNLQAGKKAKDATAYVAALQYLTLGIEALNEETNWEEHYPLTLALYREKAEVEYLNGHFESSEKLIQRIIEKAQSVLERAEVYKMLVVQYTLKSRYEEAIEIGIIALHCLAFDLPQTNLQHAFEKEVSLAKAALGEQTIASLIHHPEVTQPKIRIIIKLLRYIALPAFFSNPPLWLLIIMKNVNLCLKYGNVPETPPTFCAYGMILGSVFQDYQTAYEFGLVAIQLSEKFNTNQCQALGMTGIFLMPWVKSFEDIQKLTHKGYQAGLESGDLQYAGYIITWKLFNTFYQGKSLPDLLSEMTSALLFTQKTKNRSLTDIILGLQLIISQINSHLSIPHEPLSETEYLEKHQYDHNLLCFYFILKAQVLYVNDKLAEAFYYIQEAEKRLTSIRSFISTAAHNFYDSLIRIALYPTVSKTDQQNYWDKLQTNQQQMDIWVTHCPENFLHNTLLVKAEMARICGKESETIKLYQQAIEAARNNDFIFNQALAHQLAAKFWLAKGFAHYVKIHMSEAYYSYQLWGANQILANLEIQDPQFLTQKTESFLSPTLTSKVAQIGYRTTQQNPSSFLDLTSFIKVSQTLSREIVLSQLLKKMMQIVIENAGAETGFLLLPKNNQWFIEAEGYLTQSKLKVLHSIPLENSQQICVAIVQYVARTHKSLVLNDATKEDNFTRDPYIISQHPKSILCAPLLNQGQLIAILYLENNLVTEAFTQNRLEMLNLLSSQIAISLENAKLYSELERQKSEIEQKNLTLEQTQQTLIAKTKELELAIQCKSEFLANTSHELRTPLNGIIGLAESLIDGVAGKLSAQAKANLSMIVGSGKRLATLVNDILDFSKLQHQDLELQLKPIGLREITEIVLTLSQPLVLNKPMQLLNTISADLPPAQADENRLQQILYNLIGNAIKFTENGTVEVSAKVANSHLEIRVSDSGIGIPEDKLDRIFESFEQGEGSTAREYGGTGLGLAVTKQLVQLHQGQIWVNSTVGQGSQFFLTLPIAEGQSNQLSTERLSLSKVQVPISVEDPAPVQAGETIAGEQLKILIVDDEPVNLQVLNNYLSLQNYHIVQANSGTQALAFIAEGFKPDAILLDVMMPKMTGYEVTQTLREKWQADEMPILLLTAKNQVADLVTGLESGANDYLTKPISKDELLARLKTHLQLKELKEEALQLALENERMKTELEVTRRLQQLILPKEPELDNLPYLEIAGFMEAADEVGGDYYDVLQHNDRLLIGIGDVTGHGLESGMLMLMAQAGIRTLWEHEETEVVNFFNSLNRMIYKNAQERMEVDKNLTLSLLEYQPQAEGGVLRISGRHEDILVVRNGQLERINTGELGFQVGFVDDIAELVKQIEVPLTVGDVVVLYTDGITEAENPQRQEYGIQRLSEVVVQNWQRPVKEIRQAVIENVRQHIGKQKVFDDITLVVLKPI